MHAMLSISYLINHPYELPSDYGFEVYAVIPPVKRDKRIYIRQVSE